MQLKLKRFLRFGIIIFGFLLSFSLIRSMSRILSSSGKIAEARQKVEDLKKENSDLAQKANVVKSSDFIEKQARDKLGLSKDGEIVVVLPDQETLRALAPAHENDESFLPDPVWKKWMKLFF